MKKILILIAFAMSLSFASQARADELPSLTTATITDQVKSSDKPTIILIVGENCAPCTQVREMLANKAKQNDQFSFKVWNASDAGTPDNMLPAIVTYPAHAEFYPNFINNGFQPDAQGLDAFLAARSQFFTEHAAAKRKVSELEAAYRAAQLPFTKMVKAVDEARDAALKDEIAALKQADTAQSLSRERANRNIQFETARGFWYLQSKLANDTAEAASKAYSEKAKPYETERNRIYDEMYKATASLDSAISAARKTVYALEKQERIASGMSN